MEKTYVKMLVNFGKDYKSGEVYELDSESAKTWIDAKLAEATNPQSDLASTLKKALEERDASLVKTIKEISRVETAAPVVRVKDPEQSLGHFCQLVGKAMTPGNESGDSRKQLEVVYKSPLRVNDNNGTGYLIPEQFIPNLMTVEGYPTVFSDNTINIPVAAESGPVKMPALDYTTTPDGKGQTAFTGGITVKFDVEGNSSTETNPKWKQIELVPQRAAANIPINNHVFRSSPLGIQNIVQKLFGEAHLAKKEYVYLLGNGVGMPLGMFDLNNGLVVGVARDTASHFKYADACAMWTKLPARSQGRAIWIVSQGAVGDFLQFTTPLGMALTQQTGQGSPDLRLFNRPVVVSEFLPALGTARDVCLVDPSLYYTAETLQPMLSVSEHVNFLKDEIVLKLESWLDGQPAMNKYIILGDGSTHVSPAVYLTDH